MTGTATATATAADTAVATGLALIVFGMVGLAVLMVTEACADRAERIQTETEFAPVLRPARDWAELNRKSGRTGPVNPAYRPQHLNPGHIRAVASAGTARVRPPLALPAVPVVPMPEPSGDPTVDIADLNRQLREWVDDPDRTGLIPVVTP